jgi:hypothetical protein
MNSTRSAFGAPIEEPINDPLRGAIAALNDDPCEKNRIDFYTKVTQGTLIPVSESALNCPAAKLIEIPADISISFLSTVSPTGGPALIAFTDFESVSKRTPLATSDGVRVVSRGNGF